MNPFAGIVTWGDPPVDPDWQRMLHGIVARRSGGRPRVLSCRHAVFVQDAAEPSPDPSTLFVTDARLDNRDTIASLLRRPGPAADAELIRGAFETKGDAGIALLLGAFAFAHWNEQTRRLTLTRDCLGRRSLFFHRGEGFTVFASYLPDLLAMPTVPRRIDETTMAGFLALDHREKERTFYQGINRVPSRSCVTVTSGGAEMLRYWNPTLDAPPPYARNEDYIARARELFDRAMARSLRDTPRFAIFTSGGLDSSAIAASAARLGNHDVTCYTAVPPDGFDISVRANRYLDERPKVEALGRLYPSLRLRFVTPRGVHPLQQDSARLFVRLGLPVRGPALLNWIGSLDDAVMKDGHSIVLNGGMGNYGLTWSGAFSLAVLARQGRYREMLDEARALARQSRRKLWRVLAGEIGMRMAPSSIQRLVTRLRGDDPDAIGRFSLLNPGAIDTLNLRQHWQEAGHDPWYRKFGSPTRHRAHLMFDHLQFGRDFVAMSPALGGYEMRDPFADRELLEFCLAVPEPLYRRGGIARWFGRQVFADRLPPEILNETRRGEQAANWFESLDMRKSAIAEEIERMEASPLVCRLIDVPRLRRLLAEWPENAQDAQARMRDYRLGLDRAVHAGQFIRWVEGGNA